MPTIEGIDLYYGHRRISRNDKRITRIQKITNLFGIDITDALMSSYSNAIQTIANGIPTLIDGLSVEGGAAAAEGIYLLTK